MRSAVVVITLASASAYAQESLPLEALARVKQATCYICVEDDAIDNRSRASGSGFVISAHGTTGFIVTNAHVVAPRSRVSGRPRVKVYLKSGTKAEILALAEIAAIDHGRDLALLLVRNVADLPAPIELGSKPEPFETMVVYMF
jgi:S1-C subfamily serine protease